MDNGHEPATKAAVTDTEERLNKRIEILRAEVSHGYNDLKETLHAHDTKLLDAFYSFAESN
jgi:hypothetical protein